MRGPWLRKHTPVNYGLYVRIHLVMLLVRSRLRVIPRPSPQFGPTHSAGVGMSTSSGIVMARVPWRARETVADIASALAVTGHN